MSDKAEEIVSKFYNSIGWNIEGEHTQDAILFEDLRANAHEYVSKCRLRVLRHIPDVGVNILDMASGPIQFKEYLEYSKNFKKRYCIDLSKEALDIARMKIGDHGEFLHGSFFDIPLKENFFDCSLSLHTIYHMDKDKQEEAVRKLVKVTKHEGSIIIVYVNPNSIISILGIPIRLVRNARKFLQKFLKKSTAEEELSLYFNPHNLKWWNRFNDIAHVKKMPWRSFSSNTQKILFPNNKLGRKMFEILFYLEDRYPSFFVRFFQYPMIILVKK